MEGTDVEQCADLNSAVRRGLGVEVMLCRLVSMICAQQFHRLNNNNNKKVLTFEKTFKDPEMFHQW